MKFTLKYPLKTPGINMKITMKYPRDKNEMLNDELEHFFLTFGLKVSHEKKLM